MAFGAASIDVGRFQAYLLQNTGQDYAASISKNLARGSDTRSPHDRTQVSTVCETCSQSTTSALPANADHETASFSYLPSTVPETLQIQELDLQDPVAAPEHGHEIGLPGPRKRTPASRQDEKPRPLKQSMNTQGSDDATQPISQSVLEELIRSRSEALLSNYDTREDASVPFAAIAADTVDATDTQFTASEGDIGFLDLVSSLAAPQADSEPIPVNFSPTQSQLILTQFPESQRFKTPATAGKKRDHNGNVLHTPTQPRNPLARGDQATPGNLLGLSQAFAATQAASSPFQAVPTSALRSDRPSPQVQVHLGIENPPTSSPLRPLSNTRRGAAEPATCYVPIGQSQDLRRDSTGSEDIHGNQASPTIEEEEAEEEDSETEPSVVTRKRRKKEREARARQQLQSASSPVSPEKLRSGGILDPRQARSTSERPSTTKEKSLPSSPPQLESEENGFQQKQRPAASDMLSPRGPGPRVAAISSSDLPSFTHVESDKISTTLVPNTTRRATRQSTRSVRNVEPSPSVHRTRQEQEAQKVKKPSPQPTRIANSQVSAPPSQTPVSEAVGTSSGHESVDVIPASQVLPHETIRQKHPAELNGILSIRHDETRDLQNDREERAAGHEHNIQICLTRLNSIIPETSSAVAIQTGYPPSENQEKQGQITFATAPTKQAPDSSVRSIESSQPVRTTPPGRKRKRMTDMSQDTVLPSATQSSSFDAAEALVLDRSPETARIFAAAHEHAADPDPDPVVPRKRRKGINGGTNVPQLETEETRTPLVSMTNANISRRLSPRNIESSDNDASLALVSPVPSSGQASEELSHEATHRTPTKKPGDSVWELGKSPTSRLVPPTLRSRTQPVPETKRSRATQIIRKTSSTAAVKTPKNLPVPLPSIEETSPDPLTISMTSTAPSTPDTSSEKIKAPNMIFAYYMGRTRAYYPAVCLGFMEDSQHCKIKWPGYDAENVPRHGVCSLDLRIGDEVKVDREGFPRTAFTILGFDTTVPDKDDERGIIDVYGHPRAKIVPKQRKSLIGKAIAAKVEIVPISSLYIELSTWNRVSKRPFVYTTATAAAATGNNPPVSTPQNRPTTPSTPSSRSRHSVRDLSVRPQNTQGVFRSMVFALSFDDATKDRIARLVQDNGGTILSESFAELLDHDLCLKPDFSSAGFTALLTNKHSRREKYMQALALGLPCLSGKWVEASVKNEASIDYWQDYLLPAGESANLGGEVRSRILPFSIDINSTKLSEILNSKSRFFTKQAQIVFVTGRPKVEPKPYLFFVRAMTDPSCTVDQVVDLNAASECLRKLDRTRGTWLVVDRKDKGMADAMSKEIKNDPSMIATGKGSAGRRKQKLTDVLPAAATKWDLRVADSEFVIQSLILGRLCSG